MSDFKMDEVWGERSTEYDFCEVPRSERDFLSKRQPVDRRNHREEEFHGAHRVLTAGEAWACEMRSRFHTDSYHAQCSTGDLTYITPPTGLGGDGVARPILTADLELFPEWKPLQNHVHDAYVPDAMHIEDEPAQDVTSDSEWEPYRPAAVNRSDPRLRYYHGREIEDIYESSCESDLIWSAAPSEIGEVVDHLLTDELAEAMTASAGTDAIHQSLPSGQSAPSPNEHGGDSEKRLFQDGHSKKWCLFHNLGLWKVKYDDLIRQDPTEQSLVTLLRRIADQIQDHWVTKHIPWRQYAAFAWLHIAGVVTITERVTEDVEGPDNLFEIVWLREERFPIQRYLAAPFRFDLTIIHKRCMELVEKHLGRVCIEDLRLCWKRSYFDADERFLWR